MATAAAPVVPYRHARPAPTPGGVTRSRGLLEQLHRDPVGVAEVQPEGTAVDPRVDVDRGTDERGDTPPAQPFVESAQVVDDETEV